MDLIDLLEGDDCGNFFAGVKDIVYIIKSCDLDTVPAAVDHVISTDITRKAGKLWNSLSDYKDVTGEFSFKKEYGKKTVVTVKLFIPGITSTKRTAAAAYGSAQLTIAIKDMNNDRTLIGDALSGVKMDIEGATETRDSNNTPGIQITGTWESEDIPPIYTGDFNPIT